MHSVLLCALVWLIFQLTQSLSLKLQVHHIPSKSNVPADSMSWHGPVQIEWAQGSSVFQAVVAHFSLLPVSDLLVTPLNPQLQCF